MIHVQNADWFVDPESENTTNCFISDNRVHY